MAAQELQREAARLLADAMKARSERGQRERHRRLLDSAIDCATRAGDRGVLAKAHAAKAEDALHGASQLSLSAQRAPTLEACNDGWQRVEAISGGAASSARRAADIAGELEREAPGSSGARTARDAALRAEAAARAAARLVEERNHAYTFHTDRRFSFGEGWYLAAAAVLAGVAVQIEPDPFGAVGAETFLTAAGLGAQLQPYRPRPRAMKHTTEIVGRAFRADPAGAQRRLRAAFLGDAAVSAPVSNWIDRRLARHAALSAAKKVLVWIRDGAHHPRRNTELAELAELTERVERAGLVPVLTGDALVGGEVPKGAVDMILFWKDPIFQQADMRRAQLEFFEHLKAGHGLIGQLGVTTAGMDGPALMGLPTLYLTDTPNVRMREWVGAVPGYLEVVREPCYLERVSEILDEWSGGA